MYSDQVVSGHGDRRALVDEHDSPSRCASRSGRFSPSSASASRQELGLSETEFGLLVGTPILTGSLIRVALGIWTDLYGGRLVFTINMLAAAVATFLLSFAHTYPQMLLAALGVGLAGGSFSVGVAYVSRWYPTGKQGTALGIFGAGNVGAAVTKFLAPFVLVAFGWQMVAEIWAAALVVMAAVFWFTTERRSRARRAPSRRPAGEERLARARAAEERAGLALLALLLLRLRRLRRACRSGCRNISSTSTVSTSRPPA